MSNTIAERLAVTLPKALRTRPRDKRGYPIPFVVLIDETGTPQFTINDMARAEQCLRKRLCGLCGRRLNGDVWFIGGSKCFIHKHGAFVDPPNHYECASYALRVCPFLAAPSYAKRIDLQKMTDASYGDKPVIAIRTYDSMPEGQPDLFGLGQPAGYDFVGREGIYVPFDWRYIEWWNDGEPVNAPDAEVVNGLLS